MASDLSSGCTEVIEILDEKEEGEISLEDVSSSEEGQLNDVGNSRRRAAGQCRSCLSTKHCASWCTLPERTSHSKSLMKKDAVQEKENCHHTKDSGYSGSKHPASTLQENNNDLIPISSDSDMEIVGLTDNVKPVLVLPQAKNTKVRKRRRKRRSQNTSAAVENAAVLVSSNLGAPECSLGPKRDSQVLKDNHLPRVHRRESNSPHKLLGPSFARSRAVKSPLRRHRSPIGRARSPILRKSPVRRTRSPVRRSPPESPIRRQLRSSISPSNPAVDMYDNVKLLKKMRHLKNIGAQSANRNSGKRKGRGPSLKDKLNNMIKSYDSGDNPSSEKKSTENADDEEDLALLRKMALETKPKRNENVQRVAEVKEETQCGNNNIGDDDVEDLELRMIALRSAMLKKHQDRVQRDVMLGKTKKPVALDRTNTESPFSQSFLDSIPIPGEDNEEELETPPRTPTQVLNENTNPEDMELDSDVELEKEKEAEPYSPTDEITRQITVDSELLGIQPSDVSFITPTSQIAVVSNTSNCQTPKSEAIEIIQTGASYLPNNELSETVDLISSQSTYYSSTSMLPSSQSPTSSLYSPINMTETLENSFSIQSDQNFPATPYSPSQPIDTPKIFFSPQHDPYLISDPNQIPDTPYSPTDTPMYDLELNNTPLVDPQPFHESDTISKALDKPPRTKDGKKWRKMKPQSALIKIKLVPNLPKDIDKPSHIGVVENSLSTPQLSALVYCDKEASEKDCASETPSMKAEVRSALNSSATSFDDTMIVVDDLPETDLDGSPLVPVPKELRNIEIHIPAPATEEEIKIAEEPLYLQGVPDVTKDANKIPTLVNRSLVPASILKSNKNLQQPLLPKKIEVHVEPAFKSAEMMPVQISNETTKTNRLFKPIKLAPAIKKPQLRIVTPSAFNCSSNDNSVLGEQGEAENGKDAQTMSMNDADIFLKDLQNTLAGQAQTNMWKTSDDVQSGNGPRVDHSTKILSLSMTEQREKSNDNLRGSNRENAKNVDENLFKEKKTRSRRNKSNKGRSKHATKTGKDDKSTETKDTMGNVSMSAVTEGTSGTDDCLLHRQTSNTNKTNKNQCPEDAAQKKRGSKEKLQKPGIEKSKRNREERRDRRSGHKYDKLSNNCKKTDANKMDDRRNLTNQQEQKMTQMVDGTEHTLKNHLSSAEHEKDYTLQNHLMDVNRIDDNTANQSKARLQILENTSNDRRSNGQSSNIAGHNASTAGNTEINSVENSAFVSNGSTPEDDLTADTTTCKKVEANKRRRSSLDDDEEALRAILLASLAKRSKPSDPVHTTPKSSALSNLSYGSVNTSTESVKGLPNILGTKVSVNSVYSSSNDTSPTLLTHNHSPLSNSGDINPNFVALGQVKVSDNGLTKNIAPNTVALAETMPTTAPSRKRSIPAIAKVPLKKIAKKAPISASTKVVNNAKRYQNTLVQKKLNLQKVAMITNAQKTMSRTNLHNNKVIEGGRPRSMITQPLSDTQRFVINLASDSESENETEPLNKNVEELLSINRAEQKPALAIPMSDFEKSVDLFLKDVRKKQETAAAIKPGSTTLTTVIQKPMSPIASAPMKSPVLSTTPLAVRHLPVSLQEEYRRLKQQILEREKLKLHNRVLVNNSSPLSPSSKSSGTPPGPLSPASPIASPTISKQSHNIPSNSQSPIATAAKDSNLRSVSIQSVSVQSIAKNTVPSITMRLNPLVSKATVSTSSISNLSIQIPNETTNVNLAFKKSTNQYIPSSESHTRLVTAVKTTQDIVNTKDSKDSAVSMKDQSSLKNVQVLLQQGKTGRTVSLGQAVNASPKKAVSKTKESEVPVSQTIESSMNVDSSRTETNVATSLSSASYLMESMKSVDAIDISKKCDNSVDSSASTLIISRERENDGNSTLVDSSASTVIIPRNESADSCGLGSTSFESSKVNSPNTKALTIGPRKLRNNTETWEKIRGDVRKELDAISALPSAEQKSYLATVEQNLVKKRYAILDDLSEISGNLRQLEMEREVQSNMAAEVKKLQEQLKLAEERLQAQRSRVNKMAPNITATYEKFNSGRRECVKMTKICLGLGCLVIGANYKIPAAGAQLLNNRLKQVAGCTRQLSNKKISTSGNADEVPSKTDLPSQTNSLDKCLNSPPPESISSTVYGSSIDDNDDTVKIGSLTETIEDRQNCNTEFGANVEAEQETLKLQETTVAASFAESVAEHSPQLTSTPNSSKESSSVTNKHVEEPGTSTSTFVLDCPRAGLFGKKNSTGQRRFLEPYKSVLTHLTVPRTTDPSGILCPYELMGTCRDDDCQFVHQSARNGNIPSEVEYVAAESIPLVAAATPRDGKLSS